MRRLNRNREKQLLRRQIAEQLDQYFRDLAWLAKCRSIALCEIPDSTVLYAGDQSPAEFLCDDEDGIEAFDECVWCGQSGCFGSCQTYNDDYFEYEPLEMEYGGRFYPREDVLSAKEITHAR